MSRSFIHLPISGNCVCRSEKSDKIIYHRRYRRAVLAAIHRNDELMPHFREISNVWTWGKDGKTYRGDHLFDYEWDRPHEWFGK